MAGRGFPDQWQADSDSGSLVGQIGARLAGQDNGAAGPFGNGLADGQPQAGASRVAGACRVAAIEAVKDVGQGRGVNAIAVILNPQLGVSALLSEANFDEGFSRAMLQGIEDQVGEKQ